MELSNEELDILDMALDIGDTALACECSDAYMGSVEALLLRVRSEIAERTADRRELSRGRRGSAGANQ